VLAARNVGRPQEVGQMEPPDTERPRYTRVMVGQRFYRALFGLFAPLGMEFTLWLVLAKMVKV
jgi:hypothetical protein